MKQQKEKKDFTLKKYRELLLSFLDSGYSFYSLSDYMLSSKEGKCIILRHDIDKRPLNALDMAKIEASLDVRSSYYFRIVKKSNEPDIINEIVKLKHEIGYHYEDLTLAKGDYGRAISLFEKNLNYFRNFYPVNTVCMHGSPLSKWDNRDIWKKYDYSKFNIICEPYFDLDFNKIAYFTDTGRKWNSQKENIRDKVSSSFSYNLKSTEDMIESISTFPKKIMLNIHSQRWTDNTALWWYEFLSQNLKNKIKNIIRS